jgi:hypothetical protein
MSEPESKCKHFLVIEKNNHYCLKYTKGVIEIAQDEARREALKEVFELLNNTICSSCEESCEDNCTSCCIKEFRKELERKTRVVEVEKTK